jgi:shikimate kinase
MRVFLAGLMGSGKSTMGRPLAQLMGCRYLDNDTIIAQISGKSTVELSKDPGDVLHAWEHRYAEHVAALPPPLVAGVPASAGDRPDDLALLAQAGLLIYLRCDPVTLAGRVRHDPARPWLREGTSAEDLLRVMYDQRDPVLMRAATHTVDGTGSPDEVLAELARLVEAGGSPLVHQALS